MPKPRHAYASLSAVSNDSTLRTKFTCCSSSPVCVWVEKSGQLGPVSLAQPPAAYYRTGSRGPDTMHDETQLPVKKRSSPGICNPFIILNTEWFCHLQRQILIVQYQQAEFNVNHPGPRHSRPDKFDSSFPCTCIPERLSGGAES
jgi:hypothetical protein